MQTGPSECDLAYEGRFSHWLINRLIINLSLFHAFQPIRISPNCYESNKMEAVSKTEKVSIGFESREILLIRFIHPFFIF